MFRSPSDSVYLGAKNGNGYDKSKGIVLLLKIEIIMMK